VIVPTFLWRERYPGTTVEEAYAQDDHVGAHINNALGVCSQATAERTLTESQAADSRAAL
jgi:predicted metalloprotease